MALRRVKALARAGVHSIADLLQYYPRDYEDRLTPAPLGDALQGRRVNTIARITGQEFFGWGHKKTLKVFIEDNTAQASLVCYGRNFLADRLTTGTVIRITGISNINSRNPNLGV